MDDYRTQRITDKDLDGNRIRIPSTNTAKTKSILPSDKTRIDVMLKGRRLSSCSWNPRMGPERQRSGIIYIGPELAELVEQDEVLRVKVTGDGLVVMD